MLCLGGSTDALRVACVACVTRCRLGQCLYDTPEASGRHLGDRPPGAPRAPGPPPGKFPAPGAHFGPLPDPSLGPILGPFWGLYIYYLVYIGPPQRGLPGVPFWAPPGGPPGGPPRGAKKCTFFWVFNNSPSRDSLVPFFGSRRVPPGPPLLGPIQGYVGWDSAYRIDGTVLARYAWVGSLGSRASDGYPLDGLTSNGWYVPYGRDPPSR